MFRWLCVMQLNSAEKKVGVSLDYLRHMLRASPSVFYKFIRGMGFASPLPDSWSASQ